MKFFNCHNTEGFNIDGKLDVNFANDFCPWQMASGSSGTLLQTLDVEQDIHPGEGPEAIFENWFYDNESPTLTHPDGFPIYPYDDSILSICSTLQNGQTEAWGTMGFKVKESSRLAGIPLPYILPNTDPVRLNPPSSLPSGSCNVASETNLFKFVVKNHNFFLSPDVSISAAEDLAEVSFKPLRRK